MDILGRTRDCISPPALYYHDALYLPPEIVFYNSVFQLCNPNTMLEKLDTLENPEEAEIHQVVESFFLETFETFLNAKGTVLDNSLQQLLRYRVVDQLGWFENHNQLTTLRPLKELYLHTCCICLEKGLDKSKAMFGEIFEELWDMVWPGHVKIQDGGEDLNKQVESVYQQMNKHIKSTEVVGRVEALLRSQIKTFQKFFACMLKEGHSAKSAFWGCCKHANN